MTIREWVEAAHTNAKSKGFWDSNTGAVPEKLCLVHSEISEALEEWRRDGHMQVWYGEDGKPEGFPVELADAMLRIMDLAGGMGVDLERAIQIKHEYNKSRPHLHGKRF